MPEPLNSEVVEAAMGAAFKKVCQEHNVVAMDFIGCVTFAQIEGDETAERVMFIDSDLKSTHAIGLLRLLREWSDDIACHMVHGAYEEG